MLPNDMKISDGFLQKITIDNIDLIDDIIFSMNLASGEVLV